MVQGLPDATRVVFDDQRAVANAGVLLPAMLADRLGIEALVDGMVDLGDRDGAANPGRKVMSLVSAMALGADCIDDCDVLRSRHGRCWAMECQLRRRWERSCARSRSGMSANSTGSSLTASGGRGRRVPDRATVSSLWMSIRSSARCTATGSRGQPSEQAGALGVRPVLR